MTSATDRVGRHQTPPQGGQQPAEDRLGQGVAGLGARARRSAPDDLRPALAMIELQRSEIARLHVELAKARAPRPDTRRVRRLQSEVCRQHARAELWRHRAMLKARA